MSGEDSAAAERLEEIGSCALDNRAAALTLPPGCAFAPRCRFADDRCRAEYPPYQEKQPGHWAACWHSERLFGAAS